MSTERPVVVQADQRSRISLARIFPDLRPGDRYRVTIDNAGVVTLIPIAVMRKPS